MWHAREEAGPSDNTFIETSSKKPDCQMTWLRRAPPSERIFAINAAKI